jgi:hypothetical protein
MNSGRTSSTALVSGSQSAMVRTSGRQLVARKEHA